MQRVFRKKARRKLNRTATTNVILATLVFFVGALCFAPTDVAIQTDGEDAIIYRNGNTETNGISLMFNVYWGTEEVYKILRVLQEYQAKATFFIGGSWADDNVDCLRAIYAGGHEIGNHGYFHKEHTALSLDENCREIANCNRFIELAIGEAPSLFAPPSGAYSNDTLQACKTLGLKMILWSRDTVDWRDSDTRLIFERATKGIRDGEFVLMHPMPSTALILEKIMQYYQSQELRLITVSENLKQNNEG